MKRISKVYALSMILLVLIATSATGQELDVVVPTTEFPDEYVQVTYDCAHSIVKQMELDADKAKRVTEIVAQQYRDLSAIQDTRDAQLEMINKEFESKETIEQLGREIRIKARMREDALHRKFIAELTAELSPEKVIEVKNGMTYNVVPITFKGYLELLPGLTDEQRTKIKAYLVEAREYAMDAGSSEQKHHIFNDYKGKINNYVSSLGYDLEEAEKRLKKRREKQSD